MKNSFNYPELEFEIDRVAEWFKEYFGNRPVSKSIPTTAWMFFLNEYLMGYVVHGNTFRVFMKEVEAMKWSK